jgi:predicted ATPase
MNTFSNAGSIWRRWDLHLHAPGTKLSDGFREQDEAAWDRYLDLLEKSSVQVFGITDYFSADTYFAALENQRRFNPNSKKVFFPNIEFRLSESISKDGSHVDLHVIFDPAVFDRETANRFLTNVETQKIDENSVKHRCSELRTRADYEAACTSLDSLKAALRSTFGEKKPYLVAFPANNNGFRSTDSGSPRKIQLAKNIESTCDFIFGRDDNREYFLNPNRYGDYNAMRKPVISGSDAHSFEDLEKLSGHVRNFPPTWIKADTTFLGLKQICHEPEARVWIGMEPDVLSRLEQDGTKFISSLGIDQVANYSEANGRWFKEVNIPLNPELTVIIGNKGSGKSALVDIMGLLADSRQEDHFSFLSNAGSNRKFRQKGYAENFHSTLHWVAGKPTTKHLNEKCNPNSPERVRYLPQSFFEKLTNEIEIIQFRKEIEEVVFSHVDETDKLGRTSFSDLEEAKTLQSKEETSSLKRRLRELNVEIASLEQRNTPKYRNQIVALIAAKREELAALEQSKPAPVDPPDKQSPDQQKIAAELQSLNRLLEELKTAGQKARESLTALKDLRNTAIALRDRLSAIMIRNNTEQTEISETVRALDLNVGDIIQQTVSLDPVDTKISEISDRIAELEKPSERDFSQTIDAKSIRTIPDLRVAYSIVQQKISTLVEKLGTPERKFQAYKERLDSWTSKRLALTGAGTNPVEDSISGLTKKLSHLDNEVSASLRELKQKRRQLTEEIFRSKSSILRFYQELKTSVEAQLEAVRTEKFSIQIQASFVVEPSFSRDLLGHIDQRKKGPFRVQAEADAIIQSLIHQTNWNDFSEIYESLEAVLNQMSDYDGATLDIAEQSHNIKNFYDFLFSLDYITPRYELRLGDKNLNELSPGEKGLLLLIFYLQLDKHNTPLIIDQPEDNLDNESIFKVLSNCIRDAKRRRQVVLVTHNPNLAIGADAEQVVFVRLEKAENYNFYYEFGAIESSSINKRIVDILEGSQPAFVQRRLKYGI